MTYVPREPSDGSMIDRLRRLIVVAVVVTTIWILGWAPIPFVARLWTGEWRIFKSLAVRQRMGSWLERSDQLVGMRLDEVIGILGEPMRTENFKEVDLVYALGQERGFFGIDSEWLLIDVDANDVVVRVRISRD